MAGQTAEKAPESTDSMSPLEALGFKVKSQKPTEIKLTSTRGKGYSKEVMALAAEVILASKSGEVRSIELPQGDMTDEKYAERVAKWQRDVRAGRLLAIRQGSLKEDVKISVIFQKDTNTLHFGTEAAIKAATVAAA